MIATDCFGWKCTPSREFRRASECALQRVSAFEITQFCGFVNYVVRVFVPMMGFFRLREIHRASECTLQGLLRQIGPRGEANLVSPRGF